MGGKIKSFPALIKWTLFAIACVSFYFVYSVRISGPNNDSWKYIISGDGNGYYAYLPSLFIQNNLGKDDAGKSYINPTPNGTVIKYHSGTALCQLPFFSMAFLYTTLSGKETDGYSQPFQVAIALAGWFYLILGLFAAAKTLMHFGFDKKIISVALLLVTYGTNLFYYAVLEPSMSHIYSFAMVAVFIYLGIIFFRTGNFNFFFAAAFVFGIIVSIRPVDGVVILSLPVMFAFAENKKVNPSLIKIFTAAVCFMLPVLMQFFLWYKQCSSFFIWSYQGEGFNLLHPEIINVLFSFNKGFFIYTPLGLIAFMGLIFFYRHNKFSAASVLISFLALVYLTAAWWCWDQGDSFGMRAFIDFYPLLLLPLAFLIETAAEKKLVLIPLSILLISCLALNLVHTCQYNNGIAQLSGMTFEKYRYIFLKTDTSYRNCLGGTLEVAPYHTKEPVLLLETKNDFSSHLSTYTHDSIFNMQNNSLNPSAWLAGNSTINFSDRLKEKNTGWLYAELSLSQLETIAGSSKNAALELILLDENKKRTSQYLFRMNDVPPDGITRKWKKCRYSIRYPRIISDFTFVELYIINNSKDGFAVDDVALKITSY